METDPEMWAAAGVVSGLGAVLTAVHLVHGMAELSEAVPAVVYGVVLPLLVSLLLVGGGVWIVRRDWTNVSPWRLVGWVLGSTVAGVVVIDLLLLYQAAEGVPFSDPRFVLVMFATYGSAVGFLLGWYDVQRQTEHVRQRRKSRRLEEFTAIVSHDLRSPLNVAQGRLDLVRADHDDDNLATVADALGRMERLIDDLLAVACTGDDARDVTAVDLEPLVDDCWQLLEPGDTSLVVATVATIRADRARLRQLLENLLTNAVHHGGAGVTVTVGDLDEGSGFFVADDGPGIPADSRDQVFEQGYSGTSEGTGYGLSIVQQVADAHGWTLTLTESAAGGARFELAGVDRVA